MVSATTDTIITRKINFLSRLNEIDNLVPFYLLRIIMAFIGFLYFMPVYIILFDN